jgi:hypothetical protein
MTMPEAGSRTFGWIIGILEGEGSFVAPPPSEPNVPRIQVQMRDEDVVARVAGLWGVRYTHHHPKYFQEHGWHAIYYAQLRGHRAAEWMEALRPHMSKRRQAQIDAALASFNPNLREEGYHIGRDKAEEIRLLKALGESAASIAQRMGISVSYVYKVCSGTRRKK